MVSIIINNFVNGIFLIFQEVPFSTVFIAGCYRKFSLCLIKQFRINWSVGPRLEVFREERRIIPNKRPCLSIIVPVFSNMYFAVSNMFAIIHSFLGRWVYFFVDIMRIIYYCTFPFPPIEPFQYRSFLTLQWRFEPLSCLYHG